MSNRLTKKKVFSACGVQLDSIPALDNTHQAGERGRAGELSNLPAFREPKKRQKNHGRDEGACDGKGQLGR